ncbi:hypothetical protein RB269 [Rhodopirellula baltica SH 1]|uniref:Uncharacterized protein n=1 Tax=Rhodopirellula baltica (strain DSM 10527 / NCIMB 13988 / SH1) TaxID=243090 RepID=Q7UZ12_RHOBA|nr:hypothetical protein RB269 [Rhodopirellula baltica SH 1]
MAGGTFRNAKNAASVICPASATGGFSKCRPGSTWQSRNVLEQNEACAPFHVTATWKFNWPVTHARWNLAYRQ